MMGIMNLRVSGRVNSGRYEICHSFFCDFWFFTFFFLFFLFLIARSSGGWENVEMIDFELSTLPCIICIFVWGC